jgi:hypothetical protein
VNTPQTSAAGTGAVHTESVLLAVIVTIVAAAAGWASFTHVHDWTMRHAPIGTPEAFGWVNAVISELVPVAAFLTIRRRRRTGQPIGYPLALLIAAAALSLAAQLAVAQPSPSGWLLSAVPALAFMALVKLVFTSTPTAIVSQAVPAPPMSPAPTPEPVERTPAPAGEPVATVTPAPSTPSLTTVPIPADAFTRLNGVPVMGQVTR